jgi:hypothetical protein
VFESMAAVTQANRVLTGPTGTAERVPAQSVTTAFFEVLGVAGNIARLAPETNRECRIMKRSIPRKIPVRRRDRLNSTLDNSPLTARTQSIRRKVPAAIKLSVTIILLSVLSPESRSAGCG